MTLELNKTGQHDHFSGAVSSDGNLIAFARNFFFGADSTPKFGSLIIKNKENFKKQLPNIFEKDLRSAQKKYSHPSTTTD